METKIAICIAVFYFITIFIDTLVLIKPKLSLAMSNKTEGKSGGLADTLLGIAAIIGGAWLTAKLIENNSKKVVKYSCPNCSSDVNYKQENCNVCGVKLKWNF